MVQTSPKRSSVEERLAALSPAHRRATGRFLRRLAEQVRSGLLGPALVAEIGEHLLRLGERDRNPANTGNLEDLFCYTLEDTRDPVRAYAQLLADSVKVVPMDEDAAMLPPIRSVSTGQVFRTVGELRVGPADKMLIAHTMVAYGDPEMSASSRRFVALAHPDYGEAEIEREVAKMAVQSQHGPSSTFILARMHGLTLEIEELYQRAGYSAQQIADAQRFYDICSTFQPDWAESFLNGQIPEHAAWRYWRASYLEARHKLPTELIYQLSSDTLSNFLSGTLESGKWTDAALYFGYVEHPEEVPGALARIVNQYLAEHIALHDRPPDDLVRAVADALRPWGVDFENGHAVALGSTPEKVESIRAQFLDAWARIKTSKTL